MYLNPKTTEPYWLHNAPFQDPPTEPLPKRADIVIVGAGLTGMSTAYWLQKFRPDLAVVVLEARGVSSGATGRNAGILAPGHNDDFEEIVARYGVESAEKLIQFEFLNTDMLLKFLDEHSDKDKGFFDPEFTWTKGTIVAWSTAEEAAESLSSAKSLCEKIPGMRILSPEELQQLSGFDAFKYGGILIDKTAIAWAAKIVFCLTRSVLDKVHISTHTKVESVEQLTDGEGYRLHTNRGTIDAQKVAYCTNGWTGHLLEPLKECLIPVINQVVSARNQPGTPRFEYALTANHGYIYMSCRPNGDIIMGGMRNIVPGKQENIDDDSVKDAVVSKALTDFMFSVVKVPSVEKEWAGVMGFTKDRLPLVGDLRHVLGDRAGKGQFIAAGFTGHGMPRTFLCGRSLARLLVDQPLDDWFPAEFLVNHPSRRSWWKSNQISKL
ncbi:FAD dependent oxidoreductase [Dichotomocladium elegans]|nr:FAD dependent oxidoreductase [Dichotomocladium elegans]